MYRVPGMIVVLLGLFFGGYPTGVIPTNLYARLPFLPGPRTLEFHIFGAFGLVLGLLMLPKKKLLETKVVQFLGSVSYWVYLVHIPILFSASALFFGVLYEAGWNYKYIVWLTYLLTLGLTLAISFLCKETIGKVIDRGIKRCVK